MSKTTNWIPCNKQLPSESGRYLISIKGIVIEAHYYESELMWGVSDGLFYNYDPDAWQPLPEPYKEV